MKPQKITQNIIQKFTRKMNTRPKETLSWKHKSTEGVGRKIEPTCICICTIPTYLWIRPLQCFTFFAILIKIEHFLSHVFLAIIVQFVLVKPGRTPIRNDDDIVFNA